MNNNIDVTKMSVERLKALAYDQMSIRDVAQRNINIVNNEIASRSPQIEKQTEVSENKTITSKNK